MLVLYSLKVTLDTDDPPPLPPPDPPPDPEKLTSIGLERNEFSLFSRASSCSMPLMSNSMTASIAISVPKFRYTIPLKKFFKVVRSNGIH
jgi:hypothetical protein